MNSRDTLIINKFFPENFKPMMLILGTGSYLLEKVKKLLQKDMKDSTYDKYRIPFDINLLIELLQKEVTIPAKGNKGFHRTSIFFGFTIRLQNNILLFLNFVTSGSPGLSIHSSESWNDYLDKNKTHLDDWGRFLFVSKNKINDSEEFKSCLSNDCLQNIKQIGDKVQCKRFGVSVKKDVFLVTTAVSKLFGVNSVSGTEPMDTDEKCLNEVTSILTNNETTQNIDLFRSGTILDLNTEMDGENNSPGKCSAPSIFVIFHDSILNLKEKIYSLKDGDVFPSDFYKLFNDCPNNEIIGLSEKLQLESLPEEVLCLFVSNLFKQNEIAFEISSMILQHCLTRQLNTSTTPISRNIFTCISNNNQVNQRLMVLGVLTKLLDSKSFSSIQEDIIKKLVLNGSLKSDGVGILLNKYFEYESASMTEEFISIIEVLLNTKPSLSENSLHNMVKSMMNDCEKFSKSLKFMKLLIIIIKAYSSFSSEEKITLRKIINTNSTFMKKTALNLVKNLP